MPAIPRWVGLDNYRRLFDDPDLAVVLKNSLVFVVGSALIGQFLLGSGLALLLDYTETRGYRMTPVVYGTVLLAWVNPTLVAGFLWVAMFDFYYGSLNQLLELLGFRPRQLARHGSHAIGRHRQYLARRRLCHDHLSGRLKTIPTQIYEAARVDGAGPWRRFWDHTLPNLRHIATLTMLSITISTLGAFILIDSLTGGGPGIQTEVISLYAYHTAFRSYRNRLRLDDRRLMLSINLIASIVYLRISRPKV